MRILAADDMEGRGAGYEGERRASVYIAEQFAEVGLSPVNGSYFQEFDFRPVGGTEAFQRLRSRNVIGVLPGSTRPEQVIVLGAHYDGQGMVGQAAEGRFGEAAARDDLIWNSASDNATSVAALIEIASALSSGPRPSRTIVFVAFSAEENRLNGAFAYVRSPPLPWAHHVAMINMEKLVGHDATQFITATQDSSPRFDVIAAAAQAESGISAENFYGGIVSDTDHFAFNLAGLPALVIGTGAYENVHRNNDVFDTLQLDNFLARVRYISSFARTLANDSEPLPFAADVTPYTGVVGGETTREEMASCDLSAPGFVVTDLAPISPAVSSGLRINDVVVSVNGAPVTFGEEGANFLEDATTERGALVLSVACGANVRDIRFTIPSSVD